MGYNVLGLSPGFLGRENLRLINKLAGVRELAVASAGILIKVSAAEIKLFGSSSPKSRVLYDFTEDTGNCDYP